MIAAQAGADEAQTLATYRQLTQVAVRCTSTSGDIIVCGRRAADKWRVPFVERAAGDPQAEGVSGERNRLAAAPKPPCGQGAIIADCGSSVGVKVNTNFTSDRIRLRPLAP